MPVPASDESDWRELRVDEVRYEHKTEGWALAVTWTVLRGGSKSKPDTTGMQLYRDAGATQKYGDQVDSLPNAGGGVWTEKDARCRLEPGHKYWMAVIDVRGGNPPLSNAVPVLWEPLHLVSTAADGDGLDVVWQPPVAPYDDYEVGLDSAAGLPVLRTRLGSIGSAVPARNGLTGLFGARIPLTALPVPALDPRLPFTLRPVWSAPDGAPGVSFGPAQAAQVYVHAPRLVAATFVSGDTTTGLTYDVRVANPGDTSAGQTFAVGSTADGRKYSGPQLVAGTPLGGGDWAVRVDIPAEAAAPVANTPVPAGTRYELHVARADATSTGPALAVAVPTTGPAIVGARYSAGTLSLRVAQPAEAAALVTVFSTGSGGEAAAATATVRGRRGSVAFTAESGVEYHVRAATVSAGLLGPAGPAVPLVTSAPVIDTVRYDGGSVTVAWHTASPAARFALRLVSGGAAVAETVVGAYHGSLRVPSGDLPLAVEVAALGGTGGTGRTGVEGPASAAVGVPTAVPGRVTAATDAVSGLTSLSWPAVAGASGYEVQAYVTGAAAGPPVVVAEPGWTWPGAVPPGAGLAVTVAAIQTTASHTLVGPAGARCPLPTAEPGPVTASYDSANATVCWPSVSGAVGYLISILSAGATLTSATAGPTDTSVQIGLPDTAAVVGYRAVVQARTETGTGPATVPVPLVSPALFLSAPAANTPAHLVTASRLGDPPTDLTADLPDLGLTDPGVLPIEKGPFVLTANPAGSAQPYRLTVPAGSAAWVFPATSPGIRADIRKAHSDLLIAAEAAGANGAALFTLMNAVSRTLPQTFAETLYYAAGLDAAGRTVDLRPGLVLRVGAATYQTVAQSVAWINGYVGGASFDVEVGSYPGPSGHWLDGFDPFIARLIAAGALDVPNPEYPLSQPRTQSGVAAAADLFSPGLRQPFHRLFTPGTLDTPTSTGSNAVASNFVICAAAGYAALTALVNPQAGPAAGYFRGRSTITPCARITVNGTPTVVPLGTTVGNLLDGYAGRPPGGAKISGLTLERPNGPAVLGTGGAAPPTTVPAGAGRAVRFDWGPLPVYGGGLDGLSLPVLPGDRIGFGA